MKRFLCVFLAIILLSFAGCSNQNEPTAPNVETDSTVDATEAPDVVETTEITPKPEFAGKTDFEDNWNEYLAVNEKKFSVIMWGGNYINQFLENPDITGFRRALAAAETIGATLKVLEVPNFTLSATDYDSALAVGVDLSFMDIEFSSLKDTFESDLTLWEGMVRSIMTDSYWSYGMEYLEKAIDVQRRQAQANIDYLRLTTNYLLLLYGENSFPAEMIDKYPTIIKETDNFIEDISTVQKKVSAVLDILEDVSGEYAEIESIQNANNSAMNQAVTSEDYSAIYAAALSWGKNTDIIPLPSWDSLPVIYTYSMDDSEQVQWTSNGDDLTNVPPSLLIQCEDVSKASFTEYAEMINTLATELLSSEGDYYYDASLQFVFNLGNTEFLLSWEDQIATLLIGSADAVFAPLWYLIYAMTY